MIMSSQEVTLCLLIKLYTIQALTITFVTVASRPKILQNKSKPAPEKTVGHEKLAAVQPPFLPKAAEKLFDEKHVFSLANLSFCDKFSLLVSPK
jgi:hypothetical protein